MNQKGLSSLLTVLLITGLLIGGYFLYGQTSDFPKAPKQTTEVTPSPISDETATWKTYTTDKFIFKYPQNYAVKEPYKGSYDIYLDKSPIDTHTVISIDATLAYENDNYDKAVDSQKKLYKDPVIEEIPNGIKIVGNQGGGFGAGVLHKVALLKYKQGVIHIETADPDQDTSNLFEQILSTFKFLDQDNGNLSQADMDSIRQAVAQHEGQSLSEIRVNFDNDINKYEDFATGQVGPASGMGGGARWVAAKVNNNWVIVDIGQVGVTCDLAGKYNLPKQMVPKCIDGDNVVDR